MTSIDLWRIDATHVDGACCLFRRTQDDAESAAFTLRLCAWRAAVRPAAGLPINESEALRLCKGTWPAGTNEDLVRFIHSGREEAREQLRGVMLKRDLRGRQKVYGRTR